MTITNPQNIINETNALIQSVHTKMNSLNEECIKYTELFDTYAFRTYKDASLLKARMKEMVEKAVIDDEF